MRKKLLICSIVMSLSLLGCSDTKADKAVHVTSDSQMEMVYEESKDTYQEAFCIYRNTITDVLYLWIDDYKAGGLEEMHDPETGLPLTYKKYKEFSKDSH